MNIVDKERYHTMKEHDIEMYTIVMRQRGHSFIISLTFLFGRQK